MNAVEGRFPRSRRRSDGTTVVASLRRRDGTGQPVHLNRARDHSQRFLSQRFLSQRFLSQRFLSQGPLESARHCSLESFLGERVQEAGKLLFGEGLQQEFGHAEVVVVGELDVER